MRPTLTESIRGIRQILENVIAPEISSDYARVRFAELLVALQNLEGSADGEYLRLTAEHERLDALVTSGSSLLKDTPPSELTPRLKRLMDNMDQTLDRWLQERKSSGLPAAERLHADSAHLKGVLSESIEALSEASAAPLHQNLSKYRLLIRAHIQSTVANAPAPTARRLGTITRTSEAK